MKSYIETRAVEIANYIVENNATVRQAAKQFGISKSTVHKDITDADRLLRIDPELAAKARHILDINKSERHIRGGLATREKYLHLPHVHAGCSVYYLRIFSCSGCLLCHMTCEHTVQPLALIT